MTNTKTLRSRMKGKLSCPVLKTSGAGDSLAEFNYAAINTTISIDASNCPVFDY
jgi:hypothetical protein